MARLAEEQVSPREGSGAEHDERRRLCPTPQWLPFPLRTTSVVLGNLVHDMHARFQRFTRTKRMERVS